jgi:hypothetical protein
MGLCIWYIHNENKNYIKDNMLLQIVKKMTPINTNTNTTNTTNTANSVISPVNSVINPTDFIIDPVLEKRLLLSARDRAILLNDFAPPERRIPEYAYPDGYVKSLLNIPTRGDVDNYQLLGVVLRNNTETAYNLFGRQTYPGSNQYEYYVQGNMRGNIVKIPISINGNREIDDEQIIDIPGTNQTIGSFKVKLYKIDVPRYNPRLI